MNIVVNGASSGIGREVAVRFSGTEGNNIIAVARNENALKSLSETSGKGNIIPLAFDITGDQASFKLLKRCVSAHFQNIDILINCAGYLLHKPFEEYTSEEVASTITVNFTGIASVIRELLPFLSGDSHVISLSSMGGFQGSTKFPGMSYYSAAKGALSILTECLAAEYADRGISFNCLCLGAVETEMFRQAFPGHKAPVTPKEMADFIVEFALTGKKFFNGKILPVAVSVP